MDNKIIHLADRPEMQPDDRLIVMLEDALERAKAGELKGVAIISIMSDGCVLDGWSSGDYSRYAMLGGIESLKLDFMNTEIERRS